MFNRVCFSCLILPEPDIKHADHEYDQDNDADNVPCINVFLHINTTFLSVQIFISLDIYFFCNEIEPVDTVYAIQQIITRRKVYAVAGLISVFINIDLINSLPVVRPSKIMPFVKLLMSFFKHLYPTFGTPATVIFNFPVFQSRIA